MGSVTQEGLQGTKSALKLAWILEILGKLLEKVSTIRRQQTNDEVGQEVARGDAGGRIADPLKIAVCQCLEHSGLDFNEGIRLYQPK